MNYIKFSWLVLILFASSLQCKNRSKNITIFIHGTHFFNLAKDAADLRQELIKLDALDSFWYGPVLNRITEKHKDHFPKELFYFFRWTGHLNPKAREDAAKELYKCMQKLIYKHPNYKITLITHSHGGNVALNLAKFKSSDTRFKIDKLILLACPIQEATKSYSSDCMFNRIYNIYSSSDIFQVMDPQGAYEENKNNLDCPMFSARRFNHCNKVKQAKIKVNDRAITHVEFICGKFLKFLPVLLESMDKINNKAEHLVKIYTKTRSIKVINLEKYKGKIKKAINCQ